MRQLLTAILLGSLLFSASLQAQQAGAVERLALPVPDAPSGTALFSTFPGINSGAFGVTSQVFTDIGNFATQGADDFSVTGHGWLIDTVEVRGVYFNGAGPADSVNVYVLGNAGSLPDTTNLSAGAIYAAENLNYIDVGSGDFSISLPGLLLQAGSYWLVVQANMAGGTEGQWGWTESATAPGSGLTNGAESAWFQTSPGLIAPGNCVDAWGARVSTCALTEDPLVNPPAQRDLAFTLEGQQLVAGVTVSPTMLSTSEAGTSDSFDVVLTAPPTAGNSVDIAIGLPDASEGSVSPSMLNFGAFNWDLPQTVTVTGVDDALADGNVSYTLINGPAVSGDPGYAGLAVANVNVTNFDDESAGITVNPVSGLVVSEDGSTTATFSVQLNTSPSSPVNLPLSVSNPLLATLSTASVTLSNTSPQMVTVTGVDDDIDNGNLPFTVITGDPTSVGDAIYDALGAADVVDVSATRLDDDTAGITVTPTSGLLTTEAGGSDTFTVVLDSEPTMNVSIALSSDTTEDTTSPAMLTFTSANWDTAQTVTVTGVDDDIDDGDVLSSVQTAPAVSMDGVYSGMDANDVSVTNTDDDTAGITVTPTSGLLTTEAGGSDTFTVVLDSEPVMDVSIDLSSSDTTEGTIAPATLTFTSGNWDTAQTATVTGVDDALVDGDQAYTVVTAPAVSADPAYSGIDAADVAVSNQDDDTAGISIDDVSVSEGTGGNITATFSVTLDTAVDGGFTVDYSSNDGTATAPADYTAVNGTLNFVGSAGEMQSIAVTVIGDSALEPDETYTVDLGTPSNPAVTATDASGLGTIIDDDSADLAIALSAAPDPVIAGNQLTYTATVSNAGPASAQDVSIAFVLPGDTGVGCIGVSPPVMVSFAGAVDPGSPRTKVVTVNVPSCVLSALSATATVSSSTTDPNPANDVSNVSTGVSTAADLSLIMTIVPVAGSVGEFFVLSATAFNAGPSDAQEMSINVDIPQGLVIISSTPSAGGICASAQPVNGVVNLDCGFTGPTIPGTERTVEALLQSAAPGMIVVSADVSSVTNDPVSNNNSAAAAVGAELQPIPALSTAMLALLALLMAAIGVAVGRMRS